MTAFSNALGDDGIFVVQVGESDSPADLPSDYGSENRLLTFRQHLIDIGFHDIVEVREYLQCHPPHFLIRTYSIPNPTAASGLLGAIKWQ